MPSAVRVNFTGQLDWVQGSSESWSSTVSGGVWGGGGLEQTEPGLRVTKTYPHHHPVGTGPGWNRKAEGERFPALFLSRDSHLLRSLDIRARFSGLQTGTELHHLFSRISHLQMAEQGTSRLSQSHTPIPRVNLPLKCIYVCPRGSVPLESPHPSSHRICSM